MLNRNVPFGPAIGTNVIAGMATVGFEHIAEGNDPMLQSGKGIIGHVIRTGRPVVAPDVSRDPHYVVGRMQTQSEVAVPIINNGTVIGALNVESDRLAAFSADDARLLETFAVPAALSIEKAVLHRQFVEKRLIEQQLKTAHDVQANLLPAHSPLLEGYDIAGLNLPAWDIGGDYFDYLPLADGRLGLVIADVSGKGVPAALLMATFRAALRSEVRKNRSIAAVIRAVHGTLVEAMDTSRFVSAVYGILDPRSGTFTYENCGHNPPLLLHAQGEQEMLGSGMPALGMFGGQQIAPSTAHLGPGDTLLLYTDGVVELAAPDGAEFGETRLTCELSRLAARPAREIVGALVEVTRAYAQRERYDDDFTLVVVKRLADDGRPALD